MASRAGDWWVYLLELENGAWYTGISTDPRRRFQQHQSGKGGAKSMRLSKPKRLVSLEFVGAYAAAARREAQIKGLSRKRKEAYALDPTALPAPGEKAPWFHPKSGRAKTPTKTRRRLIR